MKRLTDVNILLALVSDHSRQHRVVREWWERLPSTDTLFVCRPVQMGFLRLLCTEAVMGRDIMSLPSAWSVYARLLASDRFSFVLEPFGLDATWAELCRPFGVSPKVVMDAYLAAFAKTGGYRLVSMDEGFAQYSGIVWENPCSRQEV